MNLKPLTPNQVDASAILVGQHVGIAQSNLMQAFATKEGDKDGTTALANTLNAWVEVKDAQGNVTRQAPDLKGLQLIAEQRFQHASQVFNMFSNLLDKIDQMKQRLIQKFGQG
jgi:hypothetical protein